jgi:hypothetical protein
MECAPTSHNSIELIDMDIFLTNTITDFVIIEEHKKYDKVNNPLRLSVYDLMPTGVEWNCNGKKYKIRNGNKITPLLLKDNKHIAIVEESYNIHKNKAYIIDGNNEIKYNIKDLLFQNKSLLSKYYIYNIADFVVFSAYYINEELYFFVNIRGLDYRFSFDVNHGKYGELIISR